MHKSEPLLLLTGASCLPGRYLKPLCENYNVISLGCLEENDIVCDLERETPDFIDKFPSGFHTVVHTAGTADVHRAINCNLDGTRRLLEGLKRVPLKQFVYISSVSVYGKQEGEELAEDTLLRPTDKVGQSYVLAEEEIHKFCDEKGVILTVLRPAEMYGKGMNGRGERMAAQVLTGTYFNIREADAQVSLVTAYDVARLSLRLATVGGVYNVTDGISHSLRALALAMGNNRGRAKKPFWLPLKWARLLARIGDFLLLIDRILDTRELQRRTTTLTFSNKKLMHTLPDFVFHDTTAVVGRTDKDFPYEDD